MNLLSVFEFIFLLIVIAYLVYEYASKDVALYVKILVFISWLLSFGFIFIEPLDIYFVNILLNFEYI